LVNWLPTNNQTEKIVAAVKLSGDAQTTQKRGDWKPLRLSGKKVDQMAANNF
jgi:hypothetical protein